MVSSVIPDRIADHPANQFTSNATILSDQSRDWVQPLCLPIGIMILTVSHNDGEEIEKAQLPLKVEERNTQQARSTFRSLKK